MRRLVKKRPPPKHPKLPNPLGGIPEGERGASHERTAETIRNEQRIWILELARGGMTLARICDAAPRAQSRDGVPIPMDTSEVHRIYNDYIAELKVAYAAAVPAARQAQLDRLFGAMAKILSGEVNEFMHKGAVIQGGRRVNWGAYCKVEREIALILGTHAPKVLELEVNVNATIGENMSKVLTGLSAEEYEELANEAAVDTDALVERALAKLPPR